MTEDDLAAWLPTPAVSTRHVRSAPVTVDALWAAALGLRLDETPTLGRLIQWRLPGTEPHQTFGGLLDHDPFVILDEGEHHSLSGLCGRIWTFSRDYPHLDGPEAFRTWDRAGTVRVLFAHWAEPDGNGGARLISEARVEPVDLGARLALRSLWLVVKVFERRIGSEALTLAVRRATAAAPDGPTPPRRPRRVPRGAR